MSTIESLNAERVGWIGAISLLTKEEEDLARLHFKTRKNLTSEMRSSMKLEKLDEETQFSVYQDTCTNITTQLIVNMMNHNQEGGQMPPLERVVVKQIAESQKTVMEFMQRSRGDGKMVG